MTRKSNNNVKKNNVKNNNKSAVRDAVKTVKQSTHTFSAVCRAFQEPKNTKQGKELLKAMQALGVHVTSLAKLKATDIFTAWWGGLKDASGSLQMWKSKPYLIEIGGKGYTLYTLKESGDYTRVSVYEKRVILSETDGRFDKKQHIAPTTDVVAEGLGQCCLSDTWAAKAAKAAARAEAMTEGHVNFGTAQKPDWRKVILKDGKWLKSVKKSA